MRDQLTKIKYESEVEMCKDVTPLISGILLPTKHRHIPEVPRCGGSNDRYDMMFLKNNKTMFFVEYKLNDWKKLYTQVWRREHTIGIVNMDIPKEKIDDIKTGIHFGRIFPYTGEDWQLERIGNFINGRRRSKSFKWKGGSYTDIKYAIYWYGYIGVESSLEGGLPGGEGLSYETLYKRAIWNLQEKYNWVLDTELIYSVLRYYSYNVAKNHIKYVMRMKKEGSAIEALL